LWFLYEIYKEQLETTNTYVHLQYTFFKFKSTFLQACYSYFKSKSSIKIYLYTTKWNTKKTTTNTTRPNSPNRKILLHTHIYTWQTFYLKKTSAEVDPCKLLVLNVAVCSKYVKQNKINSEFDFVSAACMMSHYYNVMNVIYWNTFVIDFIIKLLR
jgi:hypothetical protein